MGGERVPEGVRRGAVGKAQPAAQPLHQRLGVARAEGAAPAGAEHRLVGPEHERQFCGVGVHGLGHRRQDRCDAGLGPLAQHPQGGPQRDIAPLERQGLRDAQAAAVEQGQQRRVAGRLPVLPVRIAFSLADQTPCLVFADGSRRRGLDPGTAHQRQGRIGDAKAMIRIAVQAADGRQRL